MTTETMSASPTEVGDRWEQLAAFALRGLAETYGDSTEPLPYTAEWDGARLQCHGRSVRYALISLLGLSRSYDSLEGAEDLAVRLWSKIDSLPTTEPLTPGDLGLGLWAQSLDRRYGRSFTAERALHALETRPSACDSVELAWLLLGSDHALLAGMDSEHVESLGREAKRRLLELYNANTKLFYRHARSGAARAVSRRVACFANQIYPVMALAVHARRTGCRKSREVAEAVADHVCDKQGRLGQWWWLYDARDGQVVDGYPVYSVHQDGMAPMALLEVTQAGGRSYADEIALGMDWVFGENELDQRMVLEKCGLIQREIHLRGIGRVRRMIRGTLWCCGWQSNGRTGSSRRSYVVNPECRPYHLGWVLYAASTMLAEESRGEDR